MRETEICISEFDSRRLGRLLEAMNGGASRDRGSLQSLEEELDRAQVVAPAEIPADVVTMNSRVRVTDLDRGEEMIVTVVYPRLASAEKGRVSVLAPIGTALLGSRAGETVAWQTPGGVRRLRVDEVLYQPEAAGSDE
jgi:regulator of nucleoside diphosphate kinase